MSLISKNIDKAVALLSQDEIVAIPTETVYGLAGNIYSETAIRTIFKTKRRPFYNPLIVHLANSTALESVADSLPKQAYQLAEAFWPGPLTLVLNKKTKIPDLITARKPTVAIRVPNHPLSLELLRQLDFPLAAPSANPFNRISPTKASHVADYFKNEIAMVLDGGQCKNGIESTIIGFENDVPILYRLGATPVEVIEKVVGKLEINTTSEKKPEAPGMLDKHYAPITKTLLVDNILEEVLKHPNQRIGVLAFSSYLESDWVEHKIVLSETKSLSEAASKLYNALHILDSMSLDLIIAERMPNIGLGKSINDRLERASV